LLADPAFRIIFRPSPRNLYTQRFYTMSCPSRLADLTEQHLGINRGSTAIPIYTRPESGNIADCLRKGNKTRVGIGQAAAGCLYIGEPGERVAFVSILGDDLQPQPLVRR